MDSRQTCETCRHWQRRPWPNGLGWHGQGTCGKLHLSGRQIVNRDSLGLIPMLETNMDFGCNRWEGETAQTPAHISIQAKGFVEANNAALSRWVEGMKL